MILADSPGGHVTQAGYEIVEYKPAKSLIRDREHLSSWSVAQQLRPGGFAATDFDFKRPRAPLLNVLKSPKDHLHADAVHFDYPGHYLTSERGDARVKARLEAHQADHRLIQSSGDVRGLGAGTLFTLVDFPRADENKKYLVVRAAYALHGGDYQSTAGTQPAEDEFRVEVTVLDSRVSFRPPLATRKPRVAGPQTAIVCGKDGEEIWTDKYSRVMVKFHWDRHGTADDRASCWVRVAQMWAGARWGGMQIPRAGQESPGGGPNNFNEIRFEDKQGSEELYIQAEKDQTVNVKHNQTISVGGDRSLKVTGNDAVNVTGNETISVTGDQTVTVSGTRSTTVTQKEAETFNAARELTVAGTNTETITGKETATYQGGRDETVSGGDSLTVNGSNKTTTVHGQYNITADAQFQAQQGANSILLQDQVKINSGGPIHIINNACSLDFDNGIATIWAADQIDLVCGGAKISLMSDGTIAIVGTNKVTAAAEGSATALNLEKAGATITGDYVKLD